MSTVREAVGGGGYNGNSVLSAQFGCESKTALKKVKFIHFF